MDDWVRIVAFLVLSVPALVVVAFASSRLLGVRRSWLAVGVSSLVGWAAGFLLSLALGARFDDPRLFRNTVVLAFMFTMATEVAFDLMARPGSFNRGVEPISLNVPDPRRYLRSRIDVVRRTRQIIDIARRNGFGPHVGLRTRKAWTEARGKPEPVRIRQVLEQCGGMFVKVGQLVSTRTDLVPPEVALELSKLQRAVPPVPQETMKPLIQKELGARVEDVFAEFDWMPIGSASIAQVYRASLVTGEKVVVKVERPEVASVFERDSRVLLRLAKLAERNTAWGQEYKVAQLAQEFVDGVRKELDLRTEADNAKVIRANAQPGERVLVPVVYDDFSTVRLLVQERFDGPTVGDTEGVAELGLTDLQRADLADDLLRTALRQMMGDGWFHADLHPGNVVVMRRRGVRPPAPSGTEERDFELGIIDFGACGRLDPLQQASLRQMLIATSLRDPVMLRQAVADVCEIPRGVDDEALERALARFLTASVPPGGGVGADAIADLLSMLTAFGIRVPIEFTTFGRALVQLEGTLRTLSPGYSFTDAAQRVAGEWVAAERASTIADLDRVARKEILTLLPTLRALPTRVDGVLRQLERGDLTVRASLLGGGEDTRFLSKMVNRVVLAMLGAVLGVVSALLLSTTHGIPFAGDLTLLQFFGYLGLFGAVVLMLRVVTAVVRDGLN